MIKLYYGYTSLPLCFEWLLRRAPIYTAILPYFLNKQSIWINISFNAQLDGTLFLLNKKRHFPTFVRNFESVFKPCKLFYLDFSHVNVLECRNILRRLFPFIVWVFYQLFLCGLGEKSFLLWSYGLPVCSTFLVDINLIF